MKLPKGKSTEAYKYALRTVITQPKPSPMHGINVFCEFCCPYRDTTEHPDCWAGDCPLGIVKKRMTEYQEIHGLRTRYSHSTGYEENPSQIGTEDPSKGKSLAELLKDIF